MLAKKFKKILSLREMKENVASVQVSRAKAELENALAVEGELAHALEHQRSLYQKSADGFGSFSSGSCSIKEIQDSMAQVEILKAQLEQCYVVLNDAKGKTKTLRKEYELSTIRFKELRAKKTKLENYVRRLKREELEEEMEREEEDSSELFLQSLAN